MLSRFVSTAPHNDRMKKRPFSDADKEAQRRLKRLWNAEKQRWADRGAKLTYRVPAQLWDVTPANVGHYVNGAQPLRVLNLLRFADFLNVDPTEIDPTFQFSALRASDLPDEAVAHMAKYLALPDVVQRDVDRLIDEIRMQGRANGYASFLKARQSIQALLKP